MKDKSRKADSVARTSPDLLAERLAALKGVIPEAFAEGKLDIAKLREALGDAVDEKPERYNFSWAGKRDAIRLLQTPSRATLIPAPSESIDFDTTGNIFIEGDIARMKTDAEGRLNTDKGNGPEDLGVRCFKLAESRFLPWSGVEDNKPQDYANQMALYADPLIQGWEG